MKIRNSKGEALVLDNVAQFGSETVKVFNGSKKIYEGAADEFCAKYADKYRYTCCACVKLAETPEIMF